MNIFQEVLDKVTNRITSTEVDLAATNTNLLTTIDPTATATGTPADAVAAGTAILAKLAGGYTLVTFTATNGSWPVPPGLAASTEAYFGVMGGGGKGDIGHGGVNIAGTLLGGDGGLSGGLREERFDTSLLASTLNITIGAGATINGANGGITSIYTGATPIAVSSPGGSGASRISVYIAITSAPGNGGKGGSASNTPAATAGADGDTNVGAVGGNGGAGHSGTGSGSATAGSAGAAGVTGTAPVIGGAGGGGGGGNTTTASGATSTAGNGGAGGYPAGGSGGGGAAYAGTAFGTANNGNGGTAPAGFAYIVYKG